MGLVRTIADRYKSPIVPHFMDDWPGCQYRGQLVSMLVRRVMSRRLWGLLRQAGARLTISDAMQKSTNVATECLSYLHELRRRMSASGGNAQQERRRTRFASLCSQLGARRLDLLDDLAVVIAALRRNALILRWPCTRNPSIKPWPSATAHWQDWPHSATTQMTVSWYTFSQRPTFSSISSRSTLQKRGTSVSLCLEATAISCG